MSIGLFFSGLSLLSCAPSHALDLGLEETRPGLRLSAGADVFRTPGTVVVSGRYGGDWGARLGFWAHDAGGVHPGVPNMVASVDRMWTIAKFRAAAGLAWIDETNSVNGTRWNFDFTLAYDVSNRVFVEYRHQSHGAILGISEHTPNGGWNIVGVGLTF